MSLIETILSRLRELPLVTNVEIAPIPDEIEALFPAGSLTFRAEIDDGERYGKAEVYLVREVYENPDAIDSIVENVNQLFQRMAQGESLEPDLDGPVVIETPPSPENTE
jgi:hypothetical protein